MRVPFNNLAQYGEIDEIPDHATPPNAWTTAQNVTFRDGFVQKANGYTELAAGADMLCAPQYLMPYYDPAAGILHWIYPGTEDANDKGIIASFDGSTHVNRTDTTAYPGTGFFGDTVRWNGAVVNGVAVVNPQVNTPQMWGRTGANLDADFSDLNDWDASFTGTGTCAVMRGFRNFFIALDVTDSGTTPTRNPYEVRHSDIVDSYTPPEWQSTTSNRAGSKYIGEGGGVLIDCLPMRNSLIIYSENEAWPMQYVGGNEVFAVGEKALLEYGMLTQGCAAAFGAGQHFLVSLGDIVVHDGSNAESIINSRRRDSLFADLDTTNYTNSFVVSNYNQQEIWFCYPKSGATYPNAVAKWNIKSGGWSFMDLPIETAMIRFGAVPQAGTITGFWDDFSSTTWDSATSPWDAGNYNPTQRNLMMAVHGAATTSSSLNRADEGTKFGTTDMVVTLQKTGITLAGMGSNGPVADPNVDKFFDEVWPKIKGGPVEVRVGTSQHIDGPYTWAPRQTFTPSTDRKLDFRVVDGYYGAIEFYLDTAVTNASFTLDSFEVNITGTGSRG